MNFPFTSIYIISGETDKVPEIPHEILELLHSRVAGSMHVVMSSGHGDIEEEEEEEEEWIDFKRPRPQLIDTEQEGNSAAQAESSLFYNTGWCSDWAHGSDILFPVIGLSEKILGPNERIQKVSKLRFIRPITHDVTIYVYDQSTNVPNKHTKEASTTGLLETSDGRVLGFDVIENMNSPISEKRGSNPIGDALIKQEMQDGIYSVFLDEKVRGKYEKVLADFVPLRTSTILEILTIIADQIFMDKVEPFIKKDKMANEGEIDWGQTIYVENVVAKITNMPTDINLFSLTKPNGIIAKTRLDKIRTISNDQTIFPIEFYFPGNPEKPCIMYFAYKILKP